MPESIDTAISKYRSVLNFLEKYNHEEPEVMLRTAIEVDNPDMVKYLFMTNRIENPGPWLLVKMYEYAQTKSLELDEIQVDSYVNLFKPDLAVCVMRDIAKRL